MIEKLKEHDVIDPKTNSVIGTMACDSREIMDKLNELVDAVNELQKNATISKMENVQDKFAEQRKWIGKVCWFWDDDNTNSSCGILTSIDTETFKEPQFVCNDEYDYEHCKPVKPDDDIIYKGGDNDE